MAEVVALVGCLEWGVLKLASSLVSTGYKKLVEPRLLEWSSDVVYKAHEKARLRRKAGSSGQSSDMAPISRALEGQQREMMGGLATLSDDLRSGLGAIGAAATAEIAGVRAEVRAVKHDLASVRATVEECQAENMEFFKTFTASLEAAQHGIEVMRNAPLKEAEMALKNFQASKGNVRFLETAHSKAMTALVQGHTLDVELSAAIIAVSAGYVHMSKTDSPSEAKEFTVNGTLSNIVDHFAPRWTASSGTATAEGKKVLSFLLNIVSCVCLLPSEDIPVLPSLDKRLLPAFGALCANEPELRDMYPTVAGAAMRAMLEVKTMQSLFQLADEVDVDVDDCTSKDAVVQALLTSGKCLDPGPATGEDMTLSMKQVVRTLLASGKGLEPQLDATTDRAALMALYGATNGPSWKDSTGWGTSRPLGEWHGVTVDDGGRVVALVLNGNNLAGQIPPDLGRLTALMVLGLHQNQLSGQIPPELGRLTALTALGLGENQLSGQIPPELGRLTALTKLLLFQNQLSGQIPPELGRLTALTQLGLEENQLSGQIPPDLGRLTALMVLGLHQNQLSGQIPPELGRLTALTRLGLEENQLSGQIPPELGRLTALTVLNLYQNQLSGQIPPELGRLTALTKLGLGENQLSGQIPPDLGRLTALMELRLHQNQLSGQIPPELGRLTALTVLNLSQNQLSGQIPPELGGLTALTHLGLYQNHLSGGIPSALGRLASLTDLWLHDNQLGVRKRGVKRMFPNCGNLRV